MATGIEDVDAPTSTDMLFTLKDTLNDMALSLQDALRHAELDPTLQNEIWHALDDVESQISRIKRAIVAIAAGSLMLDPPSDAMVRRTLALCDAVEARVLQAQKVSAIVRLVVDISTAIDQVLNKPGSAA